MKNTLLKSTLVLGLVSVVNSAYSQKIDTHVFDHFIKGVDAFDHFLCNFSDIHSNASLVVCAAKLDSVLTEFGKVTSVENHTNCAIIDQCISMTVTLAHKIEKLQAVLRNGSCYKGGLAPFKLGKEIVKNVGSFSELLKELEADLDKLIAQAQNYDQALAQRIAYFRNGSFKKIYDEWCDNSKNTSFYLGILKHRFKCT